MKAIYEPTGKNSYCGPYVLSAVTGYTTDDIATSIRKIWGRKRVRTTYSSEVTAILREYGIKFEESLFYRTLREYSDYIRPNDTYIILITGHFVLVHENHVYDNGPCKDGIPLETYLSTCGRKRVKRVWTIKS